MIVLDATFLTSAPDVARAPAPDLPEVCFAGRSNVGKSSALNTLARRKQLARVSKTPGRTRLLNFFDLTLADRTGPNRRTGKLRICDLPGYGFARAPKAERQAWAGMIEGYLRQRESLKAVVVLVDALVGAQPRDLEMMEYLAARQREGEGPPLIVVATKADRLARTRIGGQLDRIARDLGVPRSALIAFSSHVDIGRRELWRALCDATGLFGRRSEHLVHAAPEDEPVQDSSSPREPEPSAPARPDGHEGAER